MSKLDSNFLQSTLGLCVLFLIGLIILDPSIGYGDSPSEASASRRSMGVVLSGYTATVDGPPLQQQGGCLRYWHSADSAACWEIVVDEPGTVDIALDAAVDASYAGSDFEIRVGDQTVSGKLTATAGWESYETFSLGSLQVKSGATKVVLRPTRLHSSSFGNVRAVRINGVSLASAADSGPVDYSGPVKVFVTARNHGDLIRQHTSLNFTRTPSADATTVAINPQTRYQTIEGFGGAFTESAGIVFQQLGDDQQRAILNAYFDPEDGHGYTLCRTHINSCDFSRGNYAYTEVDGDVELKHFSIERDRESLIPLIHAAQEVAGKDNLKLLASPWSPPAWMKTNGQMTGGGKLRPEYRDAWARYYCRYVEEYAKAGIPIWGLTVQNEPAAVQRWESCIYTSEEERDFVRDFLGPTLHQHGLEHLKLLVWDHNRDILFDRAKTVFDDPEASKYVWGAGFHWYVSDEYHHLQMVRDFYPDKKLLFTEGCLEGGPNTGDWSGGERYARSIINDLNHGAVGWIDWNILLNSAGGPNHVGNFCSAPIIADVDSGELTFNSSYYYLGHFSRFVRPGAKRILCGNTGEKLLSTAFVNPDGSIVVVLFNEQDYPIRYVLNVEQQQAEAISLEHSITTLVVDSPQ